MLTRRALMSAIALSVFLPMRAASAEEASRTKVVATFSILGDLVAEVGGDDIDLHVLVGPEADAHVYRPSPADAALIADADVLVVNGLGFEGWLERMSEASDFKGIKVTASDGIAARSSEEEGEDHDAHEGHDHDGMDPHAWQDLANAKIYVGNIAKALADADPANVEDYKARAANLLTRIEALETRTREAINAIPPERRIVITNHDAFGYFAAAYDVRFLAPIGISTDAEPDPKSVATLIDQIRENGVSAIFLENLSDNRLIAQIAEETGVAIGGTLYSDALSGPEGPATTYLAMFAWNVDALVNAMRGPVN